MAVESARKTVEAFIGLKSAKPGHVNIEDIARSGGRNIIDIRRDRDEISLSEEISKGLKPEYGGEKRLPTLLLYDEAGLKLFEDITYLDEYYLTNAEIEVLESQANDIARQIAPNSIVLELGSGNLRKVDILLKAIDRQGKAVEYYALDLSLQELQRTLAAVPKGSYDHVQCFGLHGTYDDGLEWLKQPSIREKPKTIISLGSSIGNFARPDAAAFLKDFVAVLAPTDNLLIGIDGTKDPSKVYHAYNDREGITHKFIENGLKHANDTLGKTVFDLDTWKVIGEYDEEAGRHQAFVSPSVDTTVNDILIKKEERVRIEESYKYSAKEVDELWRAAGVRETKRWSSQTQAYAIHMIAKRKSFALPSEPEEYAAGPIPTMDEWSHIWELWDAVTRDMIPDEELLEKPIKLRNACIFYLGHIPTFFDMKLAEVTDGTHTEPAYYPSIFERGIDPDVDNPEQCHAHSEVPDDWPPLDEILTFQGRVRQRVKSLYDSGKAHEPKIARGLWLGYEHEAMHLETLLYMLVQSEKTLPPPGVPVPDFTAVAEEAEKAAVPNQWCSVPEQDVKIGLDDPETTEGPARYFGWDVEKPSRTVHVHAFEAKARPISNGEYAAYLQSSGREDDLPKSWRQPEDSHDNHDSNGTTNGATTTISPENPTPTSTFLTKKKVNTVYGPIPLAYCLAWPVSASYDELKGCAAWLGGRIPTFEEARSLYQTAEQQELPVEKRSGTIPAVNGHLVNDGVEESPPSAVAHLDPAETFVSLAAANVGFKTWHPTPITHAGSQLTGQANFGGLWEWTATPLAPHRGYESMPLYKAYSSDFFDGKHNIVLGGSWATVPRIAGRRGFVNWYQRNYPFVWAGARVVRDA